MRKGKQNIVIYFIYIICSDSIRVPEYLKASAQNKNSQALDKLYIKMKFE